MALALGLAGCGSGGSHVASASRSGASLFTSAGCGGCHTLAAARTSGTRGPDLDQLKPDTALVARQVRIGGNGMPSFAGKLSTGDIQRVAAYVSRSTKDSPVAMQSFGSIAADFRPDDRQVSGCGHDWRCYEQAFGDLAYYRGARAALQAFTVAIGRIPEVRQDCHLISHAIGAGAYVRYRDPGRAFVAAGALAMTCSSGYYHGVLQRALHGVDASQIARVARTVCASRAATSTPFVHAQCVHGLGHGLLIYTAYDLPRALRTCDGLPVRSDQQTCTGGVFMENFTTSLGIRSPWIRRGDPIFPCDTVAAKDKLYCYLILTAHLLDVTNGSWTQDDRLVPQGGAGVGDDVLRVARPGHLRADAAGAAGRAAAVRPGRRRAGALPVRRRPRRDRDGRRRGPGAEALPARARRAEADLLPRHRGGARHAERDGRGPASAPAGARCPKRWWRACSPGLERASAALDAGEERPRPAAPHLRL